MRIGIKIVVVCSLVFLIIVGGFSYMRFRDEASQRKVLALCFSTYTAAHLFYLEKKKFPKNIEELFGEGPGDPHLEAKLQSDNDSFLATCRNEKHIFSVNGERQLFDSNMKPLPVDYLMKKNDRNDDVVEQQSRLGKRKFRGEVNYQ